MTEVVVLVSIVIGAVLLGGGIVLGVWLTGVLDGRFKWPTPPPPARPIAPPIELQREVVSQPEEPATFKPPTPKHRDSRYRYGGTNDIEDSRAFEEMQQAVARQAENPFGGAYNA